MKRHFTKRPGCLAPMYDEDERWLSRIKSGDILEVDVKRPRNQGLHKKWWSLVNFLAEHSERLPTAEHASKYVLIRLGYCTWIEGIATQPNTPIADSISFASMDDDKFNAMYDKACDLLCEIVAHVTDENVRDVLLNYAGAATEQR